MVRESQLRGYLLEETLAWLLRNSAYEFIVSADQDPAELIPDGNGFRVRGRGTTHQADVLGEFAYTPAFSLPVRLFVEAKFYDRGSCGLPVARNALGVIQDVNQNYMTNPDSNRPRRRFQYCYVLFSTSGFSKDAQNFALAHQISLIDLSGDSYEQLRSAVRLAARDLWVEAAQHRIATFPVTWMRRTLRSMLGTGEPDQMPGITSEEPRFLASADGALHRLAASLNSLAVQMLLGFPAAPFIIPLATTDRPRFMRYAAAHPSHPVRLRRTGEGSHAEWLASPLEEPLAYELRFVLPQHLESWISENEANRRRRTTTVKADFLSAIMVYYLDEGIRACQLNYEPSPLRRV